MLLLLRVVGIMLVGFAAMAIVAWGWGWWLAWAMNVGEEHGPVWRGVAIVAMALLNVGLAVLLFRWQARMSRWMDFGTGRRAPADRLYCQRCGESQPLSAMVCAVCGGTRLGVSRPAARPG